MNSDIPKPTTQQIRGASYLLPDPGGEVVRGLLERIDVQDTRVERLVALLRRIHSSCLDQHEPSQLANDIMGQLETAIVETKEVMIPSEAEALRKELAAEREKRNKAETLLIGALFSGCLDRHTPASLQEYAQATRAQVERLVSLLERSLTKWDHGTDEDLYDQITNTITITRKEFIK